MAFVHACLKILLHVKTSTVFVEDASPTVLRMTTLVLVDGRKGWER